MKAKDIMTESLIVVDKNADIYEVANLMKENDIGFIPVSDNKKIIGVITDRDIVVKIIANKDTKINNYISKKLITCNITDSIETILFKLSKNKIKRILVEDNQKVIGIISLSDILNIDYNNYDKLISIQSIWTITTNDQSREYEVDEYYL